jgi:hypothetical protein
VLDLAAGTGANVRYLAERLPPEQLWLLVDHDPDLLAEIPGCMRSWGSARGVSVAAGAGTSDLVLRSDRLACHIRTRQADLVRLDDPEMFDRQALVTASALLDLVSEKWMRAFAALCRRNGASVLLALTYDGRTSCQPEEPEDARVRELVNRHQETDKGFGAALGPGASACAERAFLALGYRVRREPSDWVLPPDAIDLQRAVLDGWARAAVAIVPEEARSVEHWLARRLGHVGAGRSRIVVGHQDLAAWPHD